MIDFTCSQKALKEAVGKVVKAVPAKAQMQILENIKIDVQDGGVVSFTGFDLTTGITARIEADVVMSGTLLINAKVFNSIVKKFPKGDIHIYSNEYLKFTMERGETCFNILALSADDYPEVERVHSKVQYLTTSQPDFKSMLDQVIYARSTNDAKPILKGVHFDVEDNNVFNLVAIDGFRCAIRKELVSSEYAFSFTVDGTALEKVSSLLSSDTTAKITIEAQKNHAQFRLEGGADCTVTTRLLQGEFYKYKNIISSKHSTEVTIDTASLIDTLDRASVLVDSNAAHYCVECDFKTDELRVSISSQKGNFSETLGIKSSGEPVRIGFNINFLLNALRAVPDSTIHILLNGAINPMIIAPAADRFPLPYTHVVLPVRLKN